MQVNRRQFEVITGRSPPSKPDPVAERLARIESLLDTMPLPVVNTQKVEAYNDRNLMARLDRLEGAVLALQKKTFDFKIERDSQNLITAIKVTRSA